jgi:Putative adhesin
MNKTVYTILACTTILTPQSCAAENQSPFQKITSLFNNYKLEKVDQRELSATSVNSISINNINGPITIKTGWKKNSIFLKTTKRAKKEEDLHHIKVVVDSTATDHLAITTKYINPKLVGLVEYELIVPASLDITLNISETGDASIKDVHGTMNIVTNDNITITNNKKSVSARTLKKGTIQIANSLGPIDAQTHQGNINGENIGHSFNAHSTSGKINIAYKKLPSTSAIDVKTTSGNITLALPTDTNAEIKGHTTHGTLISDHIITLKPYATQLNSFAWNKFKKEVDGTIGSGEATIALHSIKGNLKITEAKTI